MSSLPFRLRRELAKLVAESEDLVPAVSLAYAQGDEIVTASWGAEPETLFQAASISKPVSALLALHLVGEGVLSLHGDIATAMRWSLPPLETSNGPWRPTITLRDLLCHGAALSVWGFPGYERGEPLPSLLDILEGRPPANTEAIRSLGVPGLHAAYSGGGYMVIQQLIEDVTDRPFQDLATERILDPLRMEAATFEQPLPGKLETLVAPGFSAGHEVEGGWHVYPELAAAGLWCTPTDLVRFARGVQSAFEGERGAIIPQSLAAEMLTPHFPGWGLGVGLHGSPGERHFGHTGGNEGYRCELIASAHRGAAAAVMTNADEGGALVPRVVNRLAVRLGWSALSRHGLVGETSLDFQGTFETATGVTMTLAATATGAALTVGDLDPLPLAVLDQHTLATTDGLVTVTLNSDLAGRAAGFTLRQREGTIIATRPGS